jgi:hypothetical protein
VGEDLWCCGSGGGEIKLWNASGSESLGFFRRLKLLTTSSPQRPGGEAQDLISRKQPQVSNKRVLIFVSGVGLGIPPPRQASTTTEQ